MQGRAWKYGVPLLGTEGRFSDQEQGAWKSATPGHRKTERPLFSCASLAAWGGAGCCPDCCMVFPCHLPR